MSDRNRIYYVTTDNFEEPCDFDSLDGALNFVRDQVEMDFTCTITAKSKLRFNVGDSVVISNPRKSIGMSFSGRTGQIVEALLRWADYRVKVGEWTLPFAESELSSPDEYRLNPGNVNDLRQIITGEDFSHDGDGAYSEDDDEN